ncbi:MULTISPECIES: PTS glucose transporter subunit IIA [unclassified Actinomyces]|uniref:PTS sugar transporter subunit IIA n=1 Tax=unclassified Actinomyces TaxID=2609248 RepID=UPI0020176FB4|nr:MULTISPECIES: PTS glucose transporter subunit IIA [unclassified Actinomyces]MCL3778012.1 PTS glucose transporter subunit IIA [Actinomyces sp. AC-20-1]MCL3790265.1 PTS glucose transporter subunit IIA [Actinomyces sp. 187325]MCL3792560.1 PTS glucose transporter subunit IIA [Actinomyces sp. 186855]MCL3795053.1 PTS glucose transporter subunit IIA [Actinomyces sp. 217892]
MTLDVAAPLAGRVLALDDVPDPVFAGRFVGPGLAVDPDRTERTDVTAVAPVSGTIAKAHPHAFIVTTEGGPAILVHLGLDTVGLAGRGFDVHVREGDAVAAGDPVVTWNPAGIEEGGLSPVVPVIVLEGDEESLGLTAPGTHLAAGDVLLTCH